MELSYSPKFQLTCYPEKLVSKEAQHSALAAANLEQVLSDQGPNVTSFHQTLAESLRCNWLSNTLSGLSCLASCVKMAVVYMDTGVRDLEVAFFKANSTRFNAYVAKIYIIKLC